MRNDKLSEQSMSFSIDIINLVKHLNESRESIISNQIGRSGTLIALIFVKRSMLTARRTLSPSFKSLSKKQTKRVIGLNYYFVQITLMSLHIKS